MVRKSLLPVLLAGLMAIGLFTVSCTGPTQPNNDEITGGAGSQAGTLGESSPESGPPPVGPLVLTAPNGGEKFLIGQETAITWVQPAFLNITPDWTVTAYLSLDGGHTISQALGTVNVPTNKMDWKVSGPVTDKARIIIVLSDPNRATAPLKDVSDGNFSMVQGAVQPTYPVIQ